MDKLSTYITENYEVVLAVSIGVIFLLLLWVVILERKIRKLLIRKGVKRIDESIAALEKDVESLKVENEEKSEQVSSLEKRMKTSMRGVETIRFNPFKGDGSGGNQSFASIFLNEKGDGVSISSLNSRERTSVFSKPIKTFASEYVLTEEEKQVLKEAKKSLSS